MKNYDYISNLLEIASNTLNNETVQELIFRKIDLIEDILYHNPNIDSIKCSNMSIDELQNVLEYYEEQLYEKYKRRKLTPIQFAKEKEEKLKTQLKKYQDLLKRAKDDGNKDKEKLYKERIEQTKNLIDAHKIRMKIAKDKMK